MISIVSLATPCVQSVITTYLTLSEMWWLALLTVAFGASPTERESTVSSGDHEHISLFDHDIDSISGLLINHEEELTVQLDYKIIELENIETEKKNLFDQYVKFQSLKSWIYFYCFIELDALSEVPDENIPQEVLDYISDEVEYLVRRVNEKDEFEDRIHTLFESFNRMIPENFLHRPFVEAAVENGIDKGASFRENLILEQVQEAVHAGQNIGMEIFAIEEALRHSDIIM